MTKLIYYAAYRCHPNFTQSGVGAVKANQRIRSGERCRKKR